MELTLNDYKNRPHTRKLDYSGVSIEMMMDRYKSYKNSLSTTLVAPEKEAIEFYLLNAAFSQLNQKVDRYQPLTVKELDIMNAYYGTMADIGHRAFYYLLLICTRESRHASKANSSKKYQPMKEAMEELGTFEFWSTVAGLDEMSAVQKLIDHPPKNISVMAYTRHLVKCFELGGFPPNFGGKAWADVARPLRDFTHGKITMEMLLDTMWTLEHNNGTIFNKGMLYHQANKSKMQKILDIQRAGMIPNAVVHKDVDKMFVTDHMNLMVAMVREVFPDFGEAPIDWSLVNALGAKGHYSTPNPGSISGVKKPVKAKNPTPKQSTYYQSTYYDNSQKMSPENDPTLFQVSPTEFVKKISRKEVHA